MSRQRRLYRRATIVVLSIFGLLSGCIGPTCDRAALAAISAESRMLIAEYPTKNYIVLTADQLPPFIKSLNPDIVFVYPKEVDIITKAYFDGGWGYMVKKDPMDEESFVERYDKIGDGIYWFHPY